MTPSDPELQSIQAAARQSAASLRPLAGKLILLVRWIAGVAGIAISLWVIYR